MTIDRDAFFAHARARPFGGWLRQGQVDGMNAILEAWDAQATRDGMTDLRFLAYMLGTVYHECAATMQPIAEYGCGAGRAYGHPDPSTRQVYYGRGYVQLTWKRNYEAMATATGADLVNHPDLALEPDIAAKVMFHGMRRGIFTGRKLGDYFTAAGANWFHARRIINGLDRAADIATYAQEFFAALSDAPPAVAQPAPSAYVEGSTLWVQAALNALGASPPLAVDGVYGGEGSATRLAVEAFQAAHSPLEVDGAAGLETNAALAAALAAKGA